MVKEKIGEQNFLGNISLTLSKYYSSEKLFEQIHSFIVAKVKTKCLMSFFYAEKKLSTPKKSLW